MPPLPGQSVVDGRAHERSIAGTDGAAPSIPEEYRTRRTQGGPCGEGRPSGTVLSRTLLRVRRMTTNQPGDTSIDLAAVETAAARLQPYVRRTPTERSEALGELVGRELVLKLENLQHTGAFKIR